MYEYMVEVGQEKPTHVTCGFQDSGPTERPTVNNTAPTTI
jgi:hypothetical protein